jgi:hypothetical protein
MPEELGELTPDDVMRTADEFSASLQKVRNIEPQTESLCRTYGNNPQSQPLELVEAVRQLRQARDAVQEKGRILYNVAIRWGVGKQSLTLLAIGLQATSLTENLYRTLEATAKGIKTQAYQLREGAQPAAQKEPLRFPADHYVSKYGIPAERLESARRDGRLKNCKKQNGRWQYDDAEVRKL